MSVTQFTSNEYVTRNNVNSRVTQINNDITAVNNKFPVTVANGGTGQTSLANGQILIGNGTSGITSTSTLPVTKGGTGQITLTSGNILLGNGTDGISSTSCLSVSKGGTGQTSLTSGDVLLGNGTSGITSMAYLPVSKGGTGQTSLTSGEILLGNGVEGITSTAVLPISQGGTGGTTSADARANLGGVLSRTELYANYSGGYGSIQLSDDYTNYDYIYVQYHENYRIFNDAILNRWHGDQLAISCTYAKSDGTGLYVKTALLTFATNTVTWSRAGTFTINTSGSNSWSSGNEAIKVTQVVGLK